MVAAVAAGITWLSGGAIAGTAATIASSALLYAGTTAASYFIQQANQPKQDIGTKLHATSGGAVNQSIIVGEKETAGSLIYVGSWGKPGKTPNGFYVRVFCLQDMPSTALLSRCWTSDNKGTIDLDHIGYTDKGTDELFPADGSGYTGTGYSMGHPITNLDHDGFHYAWVKFLDGSQVAADPYLLGKFGLLADRPWTSSMIGRGRTLMIVTQSFTTKEANAEKNVAALVQGMALYDWRKDSTNGGSGAHRWGDASTYEYTANPVVILYNIMRGIYWGNTWMYGGLNWPARRFDNDSWTAAANVCDENVTLAAGGTEKRYRMGAEINLGEPPLTVMDRILATFSGRLIESGGIYKVYAGGIGASVYSFTDDDVVITEPLTGKMFPSREEICNTVTGSYCEPNNGGQMKAYAKRTNADYVAADNDEPLSKQMDFDYVRSNTQAQRLAKHALNDNRRFMTKTVAFPTLGRKLEPGDPVNWNDSVRFGFSNKKFILGDVTMTNRGVVLAILREADATDADWTVSDEKPYTVGVYGDIVPDNQTLDITVTATAIKKGDGTDKDPALKVAWPTDADMVDCKWVRLQVRILDVSNSAFPVDPVPFDEGRAVITKGVRFNESYQVRAKIIPYSDRETDWSAWLPTSDDGGVTANVGHGVTIDDVDDDAPAQVDRPTCDIFTKVNADGKIGQYVRVTFTELSDPNLTYQVRAAEGSDFDYFPTKNSPKRVPVDALGTYDFRVRAISRTGIPGPLSDVRTVSVPKKAKTDGNVDDPANFAVTATGKAGILKGSWDRPTFKDYDHSQVRVATSAGIGPEDATFIADTNLVRNTADDGFTHAGLGNGVDRWYFARHFDSSGNFSDWVPAHSPGEKGTTQRLQSDDIGPGEIQTDNLHDDHVITKKLQKGATALYKSKSDSYDSGNVGHDLKATVTLNKIGKLTLANDSGGMELLEIYGSIYARGGNRAGTAGRIVMKITVSAMRSKPGGSFTGQHWYVIASAQKEYIQRLESDHTATVFSDAVGISLVRTAGKPKKGTVLKFKAVLSIKVQNATSAGATGYVSIAAGVNRR